MGEDGKMALGEGGGERRRGEEEEEEERRGIKGGEWKEGGRRPTKKLEA